MKKIKKNDEVIVLAGKCKGQKGSVLTVNPIKNSCVVKGINLVKKHQKPNPQREIEGGIIEREASLHLSNVAIWNDETKKADRVGFKVDGEKKVRVYKSTGKQINEA